MTAESWSAPEPASVSEPVSAPEPVPLADRLDTDPENLERDLVALVLTLVELLRELMERQALRRVDDGTLTDERVERIGLTLMRLDERMTELCDHFGLDRDDLNIDLGPLGRLL